jgi:hypothetical protein
MVAEIRDCDSYTQRQFAQGNRPEGMRIRRKNGDCRRRVIDIRMRFQSGMTGEDGLGPKIRGGMRPDSPLVVAPADTVARLHRKPNDQ